MALVAADPDRGFLFSVIMTMVMDMLLVMVRYCTGS